MMMRNAETLCAVKVRCLIYLVSVEWGWLCVKGHAAWQFNISSSLCTGYNLVPEFEDEDDIVHGEC